MTASTKRRRPGGGSTVKTRQQVMEALAAVRLATAAQIRALACPGTASEATVRGGLQDLAHASLVRCIGWTQVWRGSEEDARRVRVKVWSLTPAGALVLAAPTADVTAPPGAAAAGALHTMAVNNTLIALLQVPAVPTGPTPHGPGRTAEARRSPGVGTLAGVRTHVPIPLTGTGSATADILLRAPDDRVPLLLALVESRAPGTPPVEQRLDALASAFHARSPKPWAPGTHPAVAVVLRRRKDTTSIGKWLSERGQTMVDSIRRTWPASVPLVITDNVTLTAYGPLATVWLHPGAPQALPLPDALESGIRPGT